MLSGPTLPFAEKLTTFKPKAMTAFKRRTRACESVTPPITRIWSVWRQLYNDAVLQVSVIFAGPLVLA